MSSVSLLAGVGYGAGVSVGEALEMGVGVNSPARAATDRSNIKAAAKDTMVIGIRLSVLI
jgi:hypothetical protein